MTTSRRVAKVTAEIKSIEFRNKIIHYVLQTDKLDPLNICNHWLEKVIKGLNIDLDYKLKIKIEKIETNLEENSHVSVALKASIKISFTWFDLLKFPPP